MKNSVRSWKISIVMLAIASLATAAPVLAAPSPLHAFDFDGDYVDSVTGTVTITPEGGTLVDSRHEFDPQQPAPADEGSLFGAHNQGLTLTSPGLTDPGVYSIEMLVRYDTINSISDTFPDWLKLIDFKDGGESLGIYYVDSFRSPNGGGTPDESSVLRFTYAPPVGGPPLFEDSQPVMTPGEWSHLVLTRDEMDEATAYVDGLPVFSVDDSLMRSVFDGPDKVMRFFQGDLPAITDPTGPYYEVGKGGVGFLNIYDVALTSSDVAELAAAVVPEPSGLAMLLITGAAWVRRRSRLA